MAAAQHLATALGRDVDPRWHLTVVFLGEQPDAERFDLRSAVQGHPPFPLALSGAVTLGQVRGVGVRGDTAALQSLARALRHSCREAGAVLERRPFRPHLTVGRREVDPSRLWDYEGPPWTVHEVLLVHSVLGRAAQHRVVEAFPLGGRLG